ncbi:Ras GTPase-activating protein 1 [Balamuthia mandrillaris]
MGDIAFWSAREMGPEERARQELLQQYSHKSADSFGTSVAQGYLVKRGEIHRVWRERYFVLEGCFLFYYANAKVSFLPLTSLASLSALSFLSSVFLFFSSFLFVVLLPPYKPNKHQQASKPKGLIDLSGCEVLRDITRGKKNCFQITHPTNQQKRTFLLHAKTEEDMRFWLKNINAAIQKGSANNNMEEPEESKSKKEKKSETEEQEKEKENERWGMEANTSSNGYSSDKRKEVELH